MKTLLLLVAAASTLCAADVVEAFGHKWTVPVGADWKVEREGGAEVLKLLVARPQEKPRRPLQFALAETSPFQQVTLEAEVLSDGGSLILVYAYRGEAHFNYAHLSVDTGKKQPVHNGMFHVYGGDRVRMSSEDGPASLSAQNQWHKVVLTYDAGTGLARVTVNGRELPAFKAVDLSLGAGKVGIGSFFNKGSFRNVKISGKPAS